MGIPPSEDLKTNNNEYFPTHLNVELRSSLPAALYPDDWLSGPRDSYILQCSPEDKGRIKGSPELDCSTQAIGSLPGPALLHDFVVDHKITFYWGKRAQVVYLLQRRRGNYSALARFS